MVFPLVGKIDHPDQARGAMGMIPESKACAAVPMHPFLSSSASAATNAERSLHQNEPFMSPAPVPVGRLLQGRLYMSPPVLKRNSFHGPRTPGKADELIIERVSLLSHERNAIHLHPDSVVRSLTTASRYSFREYISVKSLSRCVADDDALLGLLCLCDVLHNDNRTGYLLLRIPDRDARVQDILRDPSNTRSRAPRERAFPCVIARAAAHCSGSTFFPLARCHALYSPYSCRLPA